GLEVLLQRWMEPLRHAVEPTARRRHSLGVGSVLMARLMLIDGNSLLYRAFFALPTDLATASGQVTNAVYGFMQMLTYLLREQRPDQLVVSFDRPEPTFRHQMIEGYKAGRAQTPDILRQQMGLALQLV